MSKYTRDVTLIFMSLDYATRTVLRMAARVSTLLSLISYDTFDKTFFVREVSIPWPPGKANLISFYLKCWGFLKSYICMVNIRNVTHLKETV